MIRDTWDFAASAVNHALGDTVTWKPGTPDETEVSAVFGRGFDRVQSGEVRVSSSRPEIRVVNSELPGAPEKGDRVAIREQEYEVATPQPDVEGVSTKLILKKV